MTDYVIWLDSEKAKIFALKPSGVEKSHVEKGGIEHHSRNKKDHHGDATSDHFFHDLAIKLQDAQKILILGPCLAKDHFITHLQTHHTGGLNKKIVGTEKCDHLTDNQILSEAHKFFQHYKLFNVSI